MKKKEHHRRWGRPRGSRHKPVVWELERKPQAELDFTLGEIGSETKRLARRESCAPVNVKTGVSSSAGTGDRANSWPCLNAKEWIHHVVHACEVGMVGDVEALRCKLHSGLFAKFMLPAQAHVEIGVARAKSSVAAGADGAFVRGVIVAVHFASRQQVERMPAIVGKNGGQLKTGKDGIRPRTVNDTGHHDLMALIEFGKSAVGAQVGRILRAIIAVKISHRVESFAIGLIAQHGKIIAEALLDF